VLVSEIMLQQTQAARVASAFALFLRRFPTLQALAAAPRSEVLRSWAGLGYNRRAVALSEAARIIVRKDDGRIPTDPRTLATLPGVGPYTAAAVASLGFGAPVPAIDINVGRVVARARLGREPQDVPRAELRLAAEGWLDRADPGGWNQALMDLGREVCRPRPRCPACPIEGFCRFRREGRAPAPPARRQGPFQGSFRQLRGGVVRALLVNGSISLRRLSTETGQPLDRVADACRALAAEGLIQAGPRALAGQPAGRVRLADQGRDGRRFPHRS